MFRLKEKKKQENFQIEFVRVDPQNEKRTMKKIARV